MGSFPRVMQRNHNFFFGPLMLRHVFAALLAFVPAVSGAQSLPRKHKPAPTTSAITAADLMTRLYLFADDSMLGRDAGMMGDVKATDYIAREVRRLGLRPAGDSGGYFQTVPMVARRVDSASTMTVGGATLVHGRDFIIRPLGDPRPLDSAQVMFGGVLGDTVAALDPAVTSGKFVIYAGGELAPTPAVLAAQVVAIIGPPSFPEEMMRGAYRPNAILPGRSAFGELPTIMLLTPGAAARLLGADPATLKARALGSWVKGHVRYRDDRTDAPSRNVVAIIPGSDPVLRHQYVSLGAHSDHVGVRAEGPLDHDSVYVFNRLMARAGGRPAEPPVVNVDSLRRLGPARADSIFNGADDDGSGSVALLEIAERMARSPKKPKRSVLFIWHTAEEKGLYGSQWFAEHPTVPRDSIVANIDVDMIGRGKASDIKGGGPAYLMTVGSRRLSTEFGDLIDRVNAAQKKPFTIDLQFDAPGHPEQLYCRSDQVNYGRFGIPVVQFSTGLHPDYHELTDEPQDIDYPHLLAVTRLLYDVTSAVANLDHRLVVDHAKPDPNAACVQ